MQGNRLASVDKRRSIHDPFLLNSGVIANSKSRKAGCLVLLHQRNAFDMVGHEFMCILLDMVCVNSRAGLLT